MITKEKKAPPVPENGMTAKSVKAFRTVYFAVKALLLGVMVFFLFQFGMSAFLSDDIEQIGLIGHNYSGTFFITMSNEYTTPQYAEIMGESDPLGLAATCSLIACLVGCVILLLLVLRGGSRGKLYTKRNGAMLYAAGAALLLSNGITELAEGLRIPRLAACCSDIFATATYNFRPFYILALPFLLIIGGMVIRFLASADNARIRSIFKAAAITLFVCAGLMSCGS